MKESDTKMVYQPAVWSTLRFAVVPTKLREEKFLNRIRAFLDLSFFIKSIKRFFYKDHYS